MIITGGKSDYAKSWYHRICKKSPRLLEAKRLRAKRYYYENRDLILFRLKQRRLKDNPTPRKYERKKPRKNNPVPRVEKFRKRRGHIEPVIHDYPKRRFSMMDVDKDGVVV